MTIVADRKAIRSLRVGIVPTSHVLELSIGIEPVRALVNTEIIRLSASNQRPFVINGDWGTGKSNLLAYLRAYAQTQKLPVSHVSLNGRDAATNHPQRFYHTIIKNLRIPGIDTPGLQYLLLMLQETSQRYGLGWASANRRHSEFAWALCEYVYGNSQRALQILFGMDLYWSDYPYKKEKAINRINDLGEYLQSVGFKGLMIQFDELETMIQLWNSSSRQSAYKILKRISDLKHVWPIFATTDRLNSFLLSDYKYVNLQSNSKAFIEKYLTLPVLKPPTLNEAGALDLTNRLETLYERVYQISRNGGVEEIIDKWKQMAITNHRRLIRYAIDYFDRHRETSNY